MSKKWLIWAISALLLGSFLSLATFLPRQGMQVLLSPDETAVSVAARAFVKSGDMKVHDELLSLFPGMRPRSFVTQYDAMVPVGFLGMPLLVGMLLALFGSGALVWLTPLAALSVLYPLWRCTAGWKNFSRGAVLLIWCTFPTVLLYVSRGLFPNLPLVCAMIWAAYLVWSGKRPWAYVVAACLTGLALALRPTEALWIVAWLFAAYVLRPALPLVKGEMEGVKAKALIIAAFSLSPLAAAFVAWKTYGSPFAIGYWLRDTQAVTSSIISNVSVARWPFGFHPMHMLFNAREYLVYFFAPWTVVCTLAAALAWRERKARIVAIVGAFTAGVLLLVYGQSVYQDHVGVNVVSLGNSFLRYLLPLTPFIALATGWVCERISWLRPNISTVVILALGVWVLASFGIWTATVRDNEGVVAASIESVRYTEINDAALRMLKPGSIVLSERSDKIFFPAFRAVSPMPSIDEIRRLFVPGMPDVYYFGSELTGKALQSWTDAGFVLQPAFRSSGQVLYRIQRAPLSAS